MRETTDEWLIEEDWADSTVSSDVDDEWRLERFRKIFRRKNRPKVKSLRRVRREGRAAPGQSG